MPHLTIQMTQTFSDSDEPKNGLIFFVLFCCAILITSLSDVFMCFVELEMAPWIVTNIQLARQNV